MNIGVRGIITTVDRVLLCQNTGNKEVFWCLPGGGLEENETLQECLQRELREEFGIISSIGKLLVLHESLIDRALAIQFFFHVHLNQENNGVNPEKASHGHEIAEFDFLPIKKVAQTNLKPAFLRDLIPRLYVANFDSPILHIKD
jgi:8-oxo-dGTP diphosphatase